MDLSYSPEEQAFRDEVRGWLTANLPADIRDKVTGYRAPGARTTTSAGTRSWPPRAGRCRTGRWNGAAPAGTSRSATSTTRNSAWPARRRWRPSARACAPRCCCALARRSRSSVSCRASARATTSGCRATREPGAGSDLASLKTRAERRGDHYLVNGQKIWTTLGHYGDWIFCLVRTDAARREAAGGHQLPADGHEDPRHHRAPADPDGRRPRGQRDLLRRRQGAGGEPGVRGEQGLDRGQVPARPRAHGLGRRRRVQARAGGAEGAGRARAEERQAAARRPALSRPAVARGDRARRAGADLDALPRQDAPQRPAAGRRRVDAEDPRHRDPASASPS